MKGTRKLLYLICMLLVLMGTAFAGNITDLVEKGDMEAVVKLVKKNKALLEARNHLDRSLIHIAAARGHLDIVKFLVKNGLDVNLAEKRHHLRPLHLAARHGNLEVVKYLLKQGADLHAREKDNETALSYAVASPSLETVKFLVDRGLPVNDMKSNRKVPPVFYAVAWNPEKPEITKYLISKGAKVTGSGEGGWNLLHQAVWRGKRDLISLLIQNGISPNDASDTGATPLISAARYENLEAIQTLLDHGAKVNVADKGGRTPLLNAVSNGREKTAELLLKKKAEPGARLKFMGATPLHLAAVKGYTKIGNMLLKSGADYSARDDAGNTPLFYACRYRNRKMAKALLAAGAPKEEALKIFKKKSPLMKKLEKGTALIWYTGHSGWAIKTSDNLLIFDYWKYGPLSDTPGLMNGAVIPEEIAGQKVSVFISHEHQDHYMPAVFDWKEKVKNIHYYTGFEPKDKTGYKFLKPGKTWKLDGMEVTTIDSTDTGVAFLVKVDGLVIYHSGDHANMKRDFSGTFKPETDRLISLGLTPDLYFAPVSGCNFRDKISLKKGVYYTIDKMKPRAVFPMHGGTSCEGYAEFVKAAKEDGVEAPFHYPLSEGDWFYYGNGKTKDINGIKLAHKKEKKTKKCDPGCK